MNEISRARSLHLRPLLLPSLFLASIFMQSISVICGDPSSSKTVAKSDSYASGSKIVGAIVVVAALGLFSFFLFKFLQKKRREEQYARLLKLFEEDDELEVELGLRD